MHREDEEQIQKTFKRGLRNVHTGTYIKILRLHNGREKDTAIRSRGRMMYLGDHGLGHATTPPSLLGQFDSDLQGLFRPSILPHAANP